MPRGELTKEEYMDTPIDLCWCPLVSWENKKYDIICSFLRFPSAPQANHNIVSPSCPPS